ncbi:MAG: hypothetical protein WCC35_16205, partial [Bradyrhizobium sp.]
LMAMSSWSAARWGAATVMPKHDSLSGMRQNLVDTPHSKQSEIDAQAPGKNNGREPEQFRNTISSLKGC